MRFLFIILIVILTLSCHKKITNPSEYVEEDSDMSQNFAMIEEFCDNPYPYTSYVIPVGFSTQKIAYLSVGEGEKTLLFIHGLGSYAPAWKKNLDELQNHFRCVAIDLPGYGNSSWRSDEPYTMEGYATLIAEFIETKRLKNVTVVGHSMGGQIAMKMALNHPKVFDNLVLVAPAGFEKFSKEERTFFEKMVTPEILKNTPPSQTEFNYKINFVDFPDEAQFMIQDRFALEKKSSKFDYYSKMIPQCVMSMLDQPVWQNLEKIDKNTLIFFGENEMLIPNKFLHPSMTTEEVALFGKNKIKNSHLVMVPNSGHFVQWEGADIVNKEIIEFLKNK